MLWTTIESNHLKLLPNSTASLPGPTAVQEQCLAVAQAAPKEQLSPVFRQLYRTVGQVMIAAARVGLLGTTALAAKLEKTRLPIFT